MNKAQEAFWSIVQADLLEDRREYSVDDLQHMYELEPYEAALLFEMIQDEFPTSYREGVKARRRNSPLLLNPFDRDTWQHREWNLGWKAEDDAIRNGDYLKK